MDSFIDKYFSGSWDDYLAYFGDDWQTQYRYVLTIGETVYLLKLNPKDWDRLNIKYVRDWTYYTVWRSFALSLKFDKKDGGGASVILDEVEVNGIYSIINLEIYERDPQTNDYLFVYGGVLDLKPGRFKEFRDDVGVGVYDSSKQNNIKVRDEVNVDILQNISIDGVAVDEFDNSPRQILYKPLDIVLQVKTESVWQAVADGKGTIQITNSDEEEEKLGYYSNYVGLNETRGKILENGIGSRLKLDELSGDSSTPKLYDNSGDFEASIRIVDGEYTFINSQIYYNSLIITPITFFTGIITVGLSIISYDSEDNQVFRKDIDFREFEFDNLTEEYSVFINDWDFSDMLSTDYPVPSGGYLDFCMILKSNVDPEEPELSGEWTTEYNGNSTITDFAFDEVTEGLAATQVNVSLLYESFVRVIQLITSETDTTKLLDAPVFGREDSEFEIYDQDGEYAYVGLTKGDIIRDFPNKTLPVSLKDLFQGANTMFNLCLGYDNENEKVFIKPKSYAFDRNYFMFDLGEVEGLIIEPMSQAYFNRIMCGFPKVVYEEQKGALEVNTAAEYSINTIVKKDYSPMSKIRGDGTGQELLRRKPYTLYPDEDTRNDELLFFIDTDGNTVIEGGNEVSGYPNAENMYNQRLTPRQNLVRHGNVLLPALYKSSEKVRFVNRFKNVIITYKDQNDNDINENDDITQTELSENGSTRLFIPKIYRFNSAVTRIIIQILNANANGYLRFNFDSKNYECFIDEANVTDYPRECDWVGIAKEISEGDNKVFENDDNHITEQGDNRILE